MADSDGEDFGYDSVDSFAESDFEEDGYYLRSDVEDDYYGQYDFEEDYEGSDVEEEYEGYDAEEEYYDEFDLEEQHYYGYDGYDHYGYDGYDFEEEDDYLFFKDLMWNMIFWDFDDDEDYYYLPLPSPTPSKYIRSTNFNGGAYDYFAPYAYHQGYDGYCNCYQPNVMGSYHSITPYAYNQGYEYSHCYEPKVIPPSWQRQETNFHQWTSRTNSVDNRTGSYARTTVGESSSIGDMIKETTGSVGFKDENKTTSITKYGETSGYSDD